jgi:hypothetical protein
LSRSLEPVCDLRIAEGLQPLSRDTTPGPTGEIEGAPPDGSVGLAVLAGDFGSSWPQLKGPFRPSDVGRMDVKGRSRAALHERRFEAREEELKEFRDGVGCDFGVALRRSEAPGQLGIDAVDQGLVDHSAWPKACRGWATGSEIPHLSVIVGLLESREHGGSLGGEPTDTSFTIQRAL